MLADWDALDHDFIETLTHVFIGLGGHFVQTAPDTEITAVSLRKARLTVHVSTKINRSHLVCGEVAMILPTLGRTEIDQQASGRQFVSVEDSTCSMHASRGPLKPASPELRSEVAIVTGIAEATLGDRYGIDWSAMRDNYSVIRSHISRVVPGCDSYEINADRPGGFVMAHPPRDSRTFHTDSGLAEFNAAPIEALEVPRSPSEFSDASPSTHLGTCSLRQVFNTALLVDLVGHWPDDDHQRRAHGFRIVTYRTPRGSVAAYYPETNPWVPLVPLDSTALGSNTPTSKSVIIRLVRPGAEASAGAGGQSGTGADDHHKANPEPTHLSRTHPPVLSPRLTVERSNPTEPHKIKKH